MSRFERGFLDQVLARTSIIDVVGRKVVWDKKKSNPSRGDFWACCPFHGEKTPSFHAVESKGTYHCFGCGVSGNSFDFLMETENLGFGEAVEKLANIAGLEVPKDSAISKENYSKSQRALLALSAARKIFEDSLSKDDAAIARNYLQKRGLSKTDWVEFGLGFSPNSRTYLKDRLTAQGFTIPELLDAGLLRQSDDGKDTYDLYRNRLMFAIEDATGRTISFGARTLSDDIMPKYLNGPESLVFSKSFNLYRFHKARANSKNSPLVIAEGYMDVIALEKAGFAAVAPLGTALTEDQLKIAWRAKAKPIICFDGDSAGKKAARRALERALPLINVNRSIAFAILPEGQDPDDILRSHGKNRLFEIIEEAKDFTRFMFDDEYENSPNINTPEAKAALRARLRNLANEIKDEDLKAEVKIAIKEFIDDKFGRQTQNQQNIFNRGARKNQTGPSQELINSVRKKAAENVKKPPRLLYDIIAAPILMPQLLEQGHEALAMLETKHQGLDSLLHGILDVFQSLGTIDFVSLKHHLEKSGDKAMQTLALSELDFIARQKLNPYAKPDIEPEIAKEKWLSAIEKYVALIALSNDAKEIQSKAASLEDEAFLRLGQLVSERRRLKSVGTEEN